MYYRIILQIFLQLNKALDGVASLEICADPTFAWSFIFCLLEGRPWLVGSAQIARLRLLSLKVSGCGCSPFSSLSSPAPLSLHAVLLPSPFPDLSPRRRTTLNSFPLPHRRPAAAAAGPGRERVGHGPLTGGHSDPSPPLSLSLSLGPDRL